MPRMPLRRPRPHALFSLRPLNEPSRQVVARHPNIASHFNGDIVLDVTYDRLKSGTGTLITLGRNGDIQLDGPSIARIQASFEIHFETKVVMFYDRSHSQTSEVFGQDALPFQEGLPRKVVVQRGINSNIGLGGVARRQFQFELVWHYLPLRTLDAINSLHANPTKDVKPNLVCTVTEEDLNSQRYYPVIERYNRLVRWAPICRLGSGAFGIVDKAVDVDTGDLLAVKRLVRSLDMSDQQWKRSLDRSLKREVGIFSEAKHAHIVELLGSQGWDDGEVEIFMSLKEGTLSSLVTESTSHMPGDLGETVLHHMLQALDYLAIKGIVHRDVKPQNILHVMRNGQYHFQLGDFGICNLQKSAVTFVGSSLYMAPEVRYGGKQTHKADIWSLFVTMLWTLDIHGFRTSLFAIVNGMLDVEILSRAEDTFFGEMSRLDVSSRASAAQMLVKCFDGRGLTTHRNRIPALISSSEASAASQST